ncbi:MAG: GNAT family N-acetyltransferase [Candidatus Paceibacterota bacterium]|jgi:ribosomal protein S18 acetylase RimI-like enzyme|nr:GNAT family N-acetyltransferase [Candidatus Paceibacterota bacterium]
MNDISIEIHIKELKNRLSDRDIFDIQELLRQLKGVEKGFEYVREIDIRAVIKRGALFLLRDQKKERVMGMASLVLVPKLTGSVLTIEDVVIERSYRGQHLGRILTEAMLSFNWPIDWGSYVESFPRRYELTSKPDREAANRLYASLGFQIRQTNPYYLDIK